MNRQLLLAKLRRFIERGEGDFDTLALANFRHQLENNVALQRMFGGATPESADAIPAVPVSLFKSLDLCPQPALPSDRIFRTSGTTKQVRGVIRCRDTELYDLGALRHVRRRVGALPAPTVSLCPMDADSSLGHMVGVFGGGAITPMLGRDGVEPNAWTLLDQPCFVAATAFALDALFATPGCASLGPESMVMVTGGFKGRRVRLDDAALYAEIAVRLGHPRVVGEYGMTELSSQLWTDVVQAGERPATFVAPPWLRVRAADPVSGELVSGEGVLRFVDLCNLDSPVAIETEDVGSVVHHADGDRVELVGRMAGAEARGCSLRAEEFSRRAEPSSRST